ncbi:MAG: hypothetical protein M3P87_02570 [Actinomycetota bacterium]|nr:hypothetical protein [Actinomycetota bacterium]
MTETMPHPVDLALRAITTTLEPGPADFDTSRAKLTDAIAAAIPHQRPMGRRSWAIGLALFLVVAVLVVQTVSISPAAAVITEFARVAEARDPLLIPDGDFAYIRTEATSISYAGSDALPYLLPENRETWIGDEGTARVSTTNLEPTFFALADETAYYAADLDEGDRLGETITITQTDINQILTEIDWPTDPDELEAMIRSVIGDTDHDVVETCLEMLRATLISPELRAAVLRVIAGLDLELVDDGPDGATFSMGLDRPFPMQLRFTLDDYGHLRFEERIQTEGNPDLGVAPGTVDYTATYSVPVLVDSLERP